MNFFGIHYHLRMTDEQVANEMGINFLGQFFSLCQTKNSFEEFIQKLVQARNKL